MASALRMVVDVTMPRMHLKLADEETEIDLAALQGLWSVEQYLNLTDQTNRLIEYTDGVIEVLWHLYYYRLWSMRSL